LDSLSDLVSFGVGPSVLVYTAYLQAEPSAGKFIDPSGSMLAIVFVICGALRLARYNVYQSTRRDYFVGLPIPAAAGTVASFVLFTQDLGLEDVPIWVFGPLTLLLSGLMVSVVLYPKDRLKAFVLQPRHAFQFLVLCVIGIAVFDRAIVYSPAIVLLPLAVAYVLFGLSYDLYARGRRLLRRDADEDSEPSPERVSPPESPSKTPVAK
jgi:CDP-diacylglycerol--serine O-phosphatidyltransferase